jgi:predicted aspartyl protease
MLHRKQLLSFTLLLLAPSVAFGETAQCPGNSVSAPFHSLGRSQIAIPVSINNSGPYDFIVDTGAQITVMDSDIAKDLKLPLLGSMGVISMVSDETAGLVKLAFVEAGTVSAHDLPVVVEGLDRIHMLNPKVRGILGENFLGRFDMLIDYKHEIICFDESKSMQRELQGKRIPLIQRQVSSGDLAYTQPLQVTVYLQDDRRKGTVLRVDSGATEPILFNSWLASPSWLQSNRDRQGSVMTTKGALVIARTPEQSVIIGSQTRLITFLMPIGTFGRTMPRAGEDGLLPTMLFKRVLISYADRFVMFDPR